MHANRKMPKYTFLCMRMYKSSVLNSCIVYRYTFSLILIRQMCAEYMHVNRKLPKVHNISMHARFHTCPSPCLPIKFTCHVCVWSSCHIIIARPDLAPGRCNGHLTDPWHREGQLGTSRPPSTYWGPGAAIRRPRSYCTAHLSASVPTKAPQGRLTLAALCRPWQGISMQENLTNNPPTRAVTQAHRRGTADPVADRLADPLLRPNGSPRFARLSHPDKEWH